MSGVEWISERATWISQRIQTDEHTGAEVRVDGADVVMGLNGERWATDFLLTANQARQLAKALLEGAERADQ